MKKSKALFYRFLAIFLVFTVCTSVISGIVTYANQTVTYREECKERIRDIGAYLESLILDDAEAFTFYQNYYMAHFSEVDIPYDFDEYHSAKNEFNKIFNREFPGRAPGGDIPFAEMSAEAQKAFFIYLHEYWTLVFERARSAFDLPYTYYLFMKEAEHNVVYMVDGERTRRKDNVDLLYLGDEYYDDPEVYDVQWGTWYSGQKLEQVQEWDNAWGHTYSYYVPLIIDGNKMGLIGTEINVATVNKGILKNSVTQTLGITLILILCAVVVLFVLNRGYILRIVRIEKYVRQYTADKDTENARYIEDASAGNDEISSLGQRISDMILELDNYMNSINSITAELNDTRKVADEMSNLANKDALTGIRNKNAYDQEVRRLEKHLLSNNIRFGIAVIDLNFLKQINDSFGHEFGNLAIKNVCLIVCQTFKHSPVFRIGGDEFAVILENADYDNAENLVQEFKKRLDELSKNKSLNPWESVSAAIGAAFYAHLYDNDVSSVFKRADKAMYVHKEHMKAVRQ